MTSEQIYAVIEQGTVANTIVADDAFVEIIKPDHDDVVEITALEPRPGIEWAYADGEFVPPPPFPSWIWDGTTWNAPIERPSEGEWTWDEEQGNWVEIVEPV